MTGDFLQHRAQAGDDLLGRLLQVELAPLRMRAVDGDLLERLDQFGRALQVADQLLRRILRRQHELLELRSPQRRLRLQVVLERGGAALEAGGHRQADADGIVHLVRDAGDEAAERGQPLRVDQVLLGRAQLGQRVLGLFLRRAQLVFRLLLGDRVFAEHLDGARHRADLVLGGRCRARDGPGCRR